MKKITFIGFILLIALSSILSACSTSNPSNNGVATNSTSTDNTSSGNTNQGGSGGQPPAGGPGVGSVDTSSRVTDVAATIAKGNTSDISACINGISTAQVACLAQAFAKTLSDKELTSLKYDLTSQNAAGLVEPTSRGREAERSNAWKLKLKELGSIQGISCSGAWRKWI